MKFLSALIIALLFLATPVLAVDTPYCPSGGGCVCPGGDDDGDYCPGGDDDGDYCPGDDGDAR